MQADSELLRWNMTASNTIASSRKTPATAWNSTDTSGFFDNAHMEPGVAVQLRSGLILLIYTVSTTVACNLLLASSCPGLVSDGLFLSLC